MIQSRICMEKHVNLSAQPSGLIYVADLISREEESQLIEFFENDQKKHPWKTAGVRAVRLVKHYGYQYPYTRKLELKLSDPIPSVINDIIIQKLSKIDVLANFKPDQAIVNRYLSGQGISAHADHPELFGDTVVSISLGCKATMIFNKEGCNKFNQIVKPRSIYVMQGEARYEWTHEMLKTKTQCTTRYSVTFREINKEYVRK